MDPKTDEQGNPTIEPEATPSAEPIKPVFGHRVMINGQQFEVDEALASAISAETARNQHALDTAVRPSNLQPTAPKGVEDPDDEFNSSFFENPKQALDQLGTQLSETIIKTLEQKTSQKDQQDTFWKKFYTTHKNLKNHDSIVRLTLSENFAELERLPIEEAQTKLAERVSDRVLSLHRDLKPDATELEAESVIFDVTGSAPMDLDNEGPHSLGDVIKRRNAARRGN